MTDNGTSVASSQKAEPQKRVALYLRAASADEVDQLASIENQRTSMRQFALSQGWEIVAEYEDHISGLCLDRPGLYEALQDARAGEFDILLVLQLDRFARSIKVLLDLLDALDNAGVALRSVNEPIDTSSAMGRMVLRILGDLAEFERSAIIDRITSERR